MRKRIFWDKVSAGSVKSSLWRPTKIELQVVFLMFDVLLDKHQKMRNTTSVPHTGCQNGDLKNEKHH